MKLNKFVIVLILIGTISQVAFQGLIFARTRPGVSLVELIEESEFILVVQPTELHRVDYPNEALKNPGGWARLQVLEVWKGSFKKKEFSISWGPYRDFGFGDRIHGMAKHIMFIKRGPRKLFRGTVEDWSYWPLQRIQFPGLEGKREAIVYQNPITNIFFPLTAHLLLRDTATKQMEKGERIYRKAILLNEFRVYVKGILETLKMKKNTIR